VGPQAFVNISGYCNYPKSFLYSTGMPPQEDLLRKKRRDGGAVLTTRINEAGYLGSGTPSA